MKVFAQTMGLRLPTAQFLAKKCLQIAPPTPCALTSWHLDHANAYFGIQKSLGYRIESRFLMLFYVLPIRWLMGQAIARQEP